MTFFMAYLVTILKALKGSFTTDSSFFLRALKLKVAENKEETCLATSEATKGINKVLKIVNR